MLGCLFWEGFIPGDAHKLLLILLSEITPVIVALQGPNRVSDGTSSPLFTIALTPGIGFFTPLIELVIIVGCQ